jgi:hypothetical protein
MRRGAKRRKKNWFAKEKKLGWYRQTSTDGQDRVD